MWTQVGLIRDREGLAAAVAAFDADWRWLAAQPPASTVEQARLVSLIMVGGLMARAAIRREESRGGHYRSDFPARNDAQWGFRMAEQRTS
jgi:L-aspartate oxidase